MQFCKLFWKVSSLSTSFQRRRWPQTNMLVISDTVCGQGKYFITLHAPSGGICFVKGVYQRAKMSGFSNIRPVSVGLDSPFWPHLYISGHLDVRNISEMLVFQTFVGSLVQCLPQIPVSGRANSLTAVSQSIDPSKIAHTL